MRKKIVPAYLLDDEIIVVRVPTDADGDSPPVHKLADQVFDFWEDGIDPLPEHLRRLLD